MDSNPIKYSDLILPDSSITDLIDQLEKLQKTYASTSAELQQEAKKLADSIQSVSGATREGQTAIKQATIEAEKLAQKKRELNDAEEKNLVEIQRMKIAQQEANRIAKLQAQLADSVEGSYNRLSAQYSLNKIRLNALTEEYRKNNEAGKALEKETYEIYQRMKQLQEATGKFQLNVGNYKSAFDGLGVSFQQIARELPSLAVSANTFFLAISNNLPMFVDEINKIRTANALAAKEGGEQVSLWKKLGGAIFSWNTAITLAITALTLFGGKLVEWIKTLFQSKEEIDRNAQAMENFNEAMKQGEKNATSELVKLRLLIKVATDVTRTMTERNKATAELQKQYPDYLGNLSKEKIMAGELDEQLKQLTNDILANARARSAMQKITENTSKQIDLEFELNDALLEQTRLQKEREEVMKRQSNITASSTREQQAVAIEQLRRANQAYTDQKLKVKGLREEMQALTDANKKLETLVTTQSLITGGGNGNGTTTQKETIDRTLELIRKSQDEQLKLEVGFYTRRTTEINYQYSRRIEDLKLQLQTEKNLTIEGRNAINETIVSLEQQWTNEIERVENERKLKLLQIQKDTIELQIKGAREGTEEQLQLQRELINTNQQIALLQNSMKNAEEQQTALDIINSFNAERAKLDESIIRSLMERIEVETDVQMSEVDALKTTEREKTRLRLEAEKERIRKILALQKQFGNILKAEEIKILQNQLQAIDNELEQALKGGDIYDMLGFKLNDEKKQAISQAFSFTSQQLTALTNTIIESANKAVQASEKEVQAMQSRLDAELEARANGYANNVEYAQKELDNAKKNQQKALEQQAKAQRQQQAISALEQTSNLISASALIWKQLGFPWAIGAIGAMWASFAAAKIKASQLAKSGTEQYGEGTIELLEGGSHQSGNDIDLGTKPDGTRRRAEGGEFFAVINKRNSRKYRKIIPEVINSLNDGSFVNKYQGAESVNINVSNTTDLSELNSNVRAIKEQGQQRVYTDNGQTIVEYKNLKRIIR